MDLLLLMLVTIGMIAVGVLTWRLLQRQDEKRDDEHDPPRDE